MILWLMLCGNMGSSDYMVRRDASCVVTSLYCYSPVTLPLYWSNAEGKHRAMRVWRAYTSVHEPLPGIERWCLSENEWWGLYERVTGKHRSQYLWVMPEVAEEAEMVRLHVDSLFARGVPRWAVLSYIWYLNFTR